MNTHFLNSLRNTSVKNEHEESGIPYTTVHLPHLTKIKIELTFPDLDKEVMPEAGNEYNGVFIMQKCWKPHGAYHDDNPVRSWPNNLTLLMICVSWCYTQIWLGGSDIYLGAELMLVQLGMWAQSISPSRYVADAVKKEIYSNSTICCD